jgi:MFS family permease
MATGIYIPAVIPLITSYYEENIWSKTIAIHDSAASIGVFAAPLIALFLFRHNLRGCFQLFLC